MKKTTGKDWLLVLLCCIGRNSQPNFSCHRSWSLDRVAKALGDDHEDLEALAEEDDDELIFDSDDNASSVSFDESAPDSPNSFIEDQQPMEENLIPPSPPRRPAIYDEETGEGELEELVALILLASLLSYQCRILLTLMLSPICRDEDSGNDG